MHFRYMAKLCVLLMVVILVQQSAARCHVCSDYNIACTDETHFSPCFNNVPDLTQSFDCGEGKVCVSSGNQKCYPEGQGLEADCAPSQDTCGQCDGVKIFACTSTTTFIQCDGNVATNQTGRCPTGLLCDTKRGEICVSDCKASKPLECNREEAA